MAHRFWHNHPHPLCRGLAVLVATALVGSTWPPLAWAALPSEVRDESVGAAKQADTPALLDPHQLRIPKELGRIVDVFSPESEGEAPSRLILHLQDLHTQYTVQRTLAKLIEHLHDTAGVSLIALEGGAGPGDTEFFSAFPDKVTTDQLADFFLKKGLFTGPVYYAVTHPGTVSLYGAEDATAYLEHLATYQEGHPKQQEAAKQLQAVLAVLKERQRALYPQALKTLSAKAEALESGTLRLSEDLQTLVALAREQDMALAAYPNLQRLHEMATLQAGLDMEAVQEEHDTLRDRLIDELSDEAYEAFEAHEDALADKSISYAAYLKGLAPFAKYLDIDLSAPSAGATDPYANLKTYTEVLRIDEGLDHEQLAPELKALLTALRDKLLTTDAQRQLAQLTTTLGLVHDLIEVRLSPEELAYYEAHQADFTATPFLRFLEQQKQLTPTLRQAITSLFADLSAQERFYELAQKRDEALVTNTLQQMQEQQEPVAILVSGGFHTEGFTRLLKDKEVAYAVISPAVDGNLDETLYSSLLLNEVPSLEDLVRELSAEVVRGNKSKPAPQWDDDTLVQSQGITSLDSLIQVMQAKEPALGRTDEGEEAPRLSKRSYLQAAWVLGYIAARLSKEGVTVENVVEEVQQATHPLARQVEILEQTDKRLQVAINGATGTFEVVDVDQEQEVVFAVELQQEATRVAALGPDAQLPLGQGVPGQLGEPGPASPAGGAVTVTGQPLAPEQEAALNAAIKRDFDEGRARLLRAEELEALDPEGVTRANGVLVYQIPSLAEFDEFLVAHPGRGGDTFDHQLRQIYLSPAKLEFIRGLSPEAKRQFWTHEVGHIDMANETGGQATEAQVVARFPIASVLAEAQVALGRPALPATRQGPGAELGRAWTLYQETLRSMFEETVASYRRAREFHQYTWQYQAEFAGELLNHPGTFELARTMLEESYEQALELRERGRTFSVIGTVVKEMGRQRDLRERAVELIFDPRTYGFARAASAQWGEEIRDLIGPERQLPAGQPIPEEPDKELIRRVSDRLSGLVPRREEAGLPAERRRVSIHDPEVLWRMSTLILSLLESIGEDDLALSSRLLDVRMQLVEWGREVGDQRDQLGEFFASEIATLKDHVLLLPKLKELAELGATEAGRGDALTQIVDGYLKAGQTDEAFEVFLTIKEMTAPVSYDVIATFATAPEYREEVLEHVRRVGGERRYMHLLAAADALAAQGQGETASELYREAWELSARSRYHEDNVVEQFIRVARETGMTFGEPRQGLDELLDAARRAATEWLENTDARTARDDTRRIWFVENTIRELTMAGRYEQAEALALLLDRKHRIEYWGDEADDMRPEELDKAYRVMAIAAAHRHDLDRIEEYLGKMDEFKPETTLEIAKILAGKGDYENSIVASILSFEGIEVESGLMLDKASLGAASQRLAGVDPGESLFEVAKIMLEQDMDRERIGRGLAKAAEVGLGDRTLEELVEVVRENPELAPFLTDILENALRSNRSIIAHHQHRVILRALRRFHPDLAGLSPDVPTDVAEAGLEDPGAGPGGGSIIEAANQRVREGDALAAEGHYDEARAAWQTAIAGEEDAGVVGYDGIIVSAESALMVEAAKANKALAQRKILVASVLQHDPLLAESETNIGGALRALGAKRQPLIYLVGSGALETATGLATLMTLRNQIDASGTTGLVSLVYVHTDRVVTQEDLFGALQLQPGELFDVMANGKAVARDPQAMKSYVVEQVNARLGAYRTRTALTKDMVPDVEDLTYHNTITLATNALGEVAAVGEPTEEEAIFRQLVEEAIHVQVVQPASVAEAVEQQAVADYSKAVTSSLLAVTEAEAVPEPLQQDVMQVRQAARERRTVRIAPRVSDVLHTIDQEFKQRLLEQEVLEIQG